MINIKKIIKKLKQASNYTGDIVGTVSADAVLAATATQLIEEGLLTFIRII